MSVRDEVILRHSPPWILQHISKSRRGQFASFVAGPEEKLSMENGTSQQDSLARTYILAKDDETKVRRLVEEARKAEILAEKLEKRVTMVGKLYSLRLVHE